MSRYADAVERANCALDLSKQIVGIRFLFSKEAFDAAEPEQPERRMSYCRMVAGAARGKEMKVDVTNFECFASARVLGIVGLDDWYTSGNYYGTCGLYEDFATAKEVTDHMSMCGHKAYGLEVKPLKNFTAEPHVAIVISIPFNIMRLVQGYSYKFGTYAGYKFIGNQAMCSECTAQPYKANAINLSLMCAGARQNGMKKDELAIGVTANKFVAMIDGLCKTITPVELDPRKKQIQENFSGAGISDVDIVPDTNYWVAMSEYDSKQFT